MKPNQQIRDAAEKAGIPLYAVGAVAYHCNDGNFSRRLRNELPAEEQQRLLEIIKALEAELSALSQNP